jgi:hypothetical protein
MLGEESQSDFGRVTQVRQFRRQAARDRVQIGAELGHRLQKDRFHLRPQHVIAALCRIGERDLVCLFLREAISLGTDCAATLLHYPWQRGMEIDLDRPPLAPTGPVRHPIPHPVGHRGRRDAYQFGELVAVYGR